jgi:Bacteriophage minor capsid protein
MMANTLTHSPAQVVAQMLVDLGLGTAGGGGSAWPVHHSSEPDTPDEVVTVYDTAGLDHGRSMIDGDLMGPSGFQVRVRSKNHATGWLKADAIQTTLASLYQRTVRVEATLYKVHAVVRIGDVLSLGKETPTSSRRLFTVNGSVYLKAT